MDYSVHCHPRAYGAPTWTMHSEPTAWWFGLNSSKKNRKKCEELEHENKNLQYYVNVCRARQNETLQLRQHLSTSHIQIDILKNRIKDLEENSDSSIWGFIWTRTYKEMEKKMIDHKRSEVYVEIKFVHHLYERLFEHILYRYGENIKLVNPFLKKMHEDMNMQIQKIEELIQEYKNSCYSDMIFPNRKPFEKLMAKALFVLCCTDVVNIIAKFAITDRFHEEYKEKNDQLYEETKRLANLQKNNHEMNLLLILYKNYTYKYLNGMITPKYQGGVGLQLYIGEIEQKLKNTYTNAETNHDSILQEFNTYINE